MALRSTLQGSPSGKGSSALPMAPRAAKVFRTEQGDVGLDLDLLGRQDPQDSGWSLAQSDTPKGLTPTHALIFPLDSGAALRHRPTLDHQAEGGSRATWELGLHRNALDHWNKSSSPSSVSSSQLPTKPWSPTHHTPSAHTHRSLPYISVLTQFWNFQGFSNITKKRNSCICLCV